MLSKILWVGSILVVAGLAAVGCSDDSSDEPGGGGSAGTATGGGAGTANGGSHSGGSSNGGSSNGGSSNGGSSNGGSSNGGSSGGATGGVTGDVPTVGGCPVFTADDDWNRDISGEPVDATWTANIIAQAQANGHNNLHPDFYTDGADRFGMPINIVPESQAAVAVEFTDYADESDPGPYPFPSPDSYRAEGGDAYACDGDCHGLIVQQGTCMLYEVGSCTYNNGWACIVGAKWNLRANSYGQRPMGWTSADAAGLSVMAGLVRYDEVMAGVMRHAIRFTMDCTQAAYVKPATHRAVPGGCGAATDPPMGLRVRLRASYDISGFNAQAQVVLTAMKTYGMILADNGSSFYFQGEENAGWGEDIQQLKDVPVDQFEAIVPGPLSGQ